MITTNYKNYECRKVGNQFLMVSLEIERQADAMIDRTQIELCRYPETLAKYNINVNKDTLVGVVREGSEYLRNIKRNEIEQWLISSNAPIPESMRTKMKEESALEYCPNELSQALHDIVTDIQDIWQGSGMALTETDCDFEESAVSVNKKRMMKRLINQMSKVITEDDNEVVRRFRKFWEDIEWMESKGYSIMPFMAGKYGGILDTLLDLVDTPDSPMQSDATLLAFLMNRKIGVPWRERNQERWAAMMGVGNKDHAIFNPIKDKEGNIIGRAEAVTIPVVPVYNESGQLLDYKQIEKYGSDLD